MARPLWPAPTMTVVTSRDSLMRTSLWRPSLLLDLHRDVRRVRQDVVHGGTLLRLRYECFDVFRRGIRVDIERDANVLEAVADVRVGPEDAENVHLAFELRFDRLELDVPVLGHRGNAGGQAACETNQHVLDRRCAVVFGCEHFRVVGVEGELRLVILLATKAAKAANGRLAVGAVDPFAGRPPLELRTGRLSSASRAASARRRSLRFVPST